MSDTNPPKPKRRWYQFSLRTLLVLVTLFAVACSWYAYEMREAAKRRAAIAELEELGALVRYYDPDDTTTPEEYRDGEPPRWYSFLRRLHGDRYLGHAVGFATGNIDDPVTDAHMAHLARLTDLEYITLCRAEITDNGLAHLKDLTKLEYLVIVSPHITDAGLVHLRGLSKLKNVDLVRAQVTDEGVEKLEEALPDCIVGY